MKDTGMDKDTKALVERLHKLSMQTTVSFPGYLADAAEALQSQAREIERLEAWCEHLDKALEISKLETKCAEQGWPEPKRLKAENERLEAWVNDLQAGMYINCVYCGHRYGPDTEVPATMAEVLKEHISECPKHPLSHALAEIERLADCLDRTEQACEKQTARAARIGKLNEALMECSLVGDTDGNGVVECPSCLSAFPWDKPKHSDDCPVLRAEQLLGEQ